MADCIGVVLAAMGVFPVVARRVGIALAAEMKWYDWAATGVWLAGEIAAFVASGGVAMAGQVAIIVGTAAFLAIDIDKYGEGCC